MLYQSIRESLLQLQLQVISSMYKFKVMNLGAHQHRLIAMVEVTTGFKARRAGMGQTCQHEVVGNVFAARLYLDYDPGMPPLEAPGRTGGTQYG